MGDTMGPYAFRLKAVSMSVSAPSFLRRHLLGAVGELPRICHLASGPSRLQAECMCLNLRIVDMVRHPIPSGVMALDRKQSEYRVVEVLLSGPNERLRNVLDQVLDRARVRGGGTATDIAVNREIESLTGAHSDQALLRLALFMWNGDPPIGLDDLAVLDDENRQRFLRALATKLQVHWAAPRL